MMDEITLTASQIRYLLVLKRLDKGDGVKSVDIANELQLSKPSVHNMMDFFLEQDIIHKEPKRQVYLTERGLKMAKEYEAYHMVLKRKLFSGKAPDCTADIAICAFLAELSKKNLKDLTKSKEYGNAHRKNRQ